MREPTPTEREKHRNGITLDELDILVPAYVRQDIEGCHPGTDQVYVEIERQGAIGCIRGINIDRGEVFADWGFHDQWWATPDEVSLVDVRFTPPSATAMVAV